MLSWTAWKKVRGEKLTLHHTVSPKDDSQEQSLLVPMPGNSVCLWGSCFAFILSSAYLSADHISLLALTVRKLQIKVMARLSQLRGRDFVDQYRPPAFFSFLSPKQSPLY